MNPKKLFATLTSTAMVLTMAGCTTKTVNNVLTVGINAAMNGVFSPMYYESTYDGYAIDLMYQSLLAYNAKQELVPELAKNLPKISENGKTYTFKLKEDILFSDGTPCTSSDVKYSFTVMADPSYTGRFSNFSSNIVGYEEYNQGDATELSGIETPDEHTIIFHMKEPRIDALSTLGTMDICSDEQFEYIKGNTKEIEENTDQPIGTGAYILNSYDKAAGASFSRNDKFKSEDGKYSIDKIIIKHTETATEIDELKSGSVDYLPSISDPGKISSVSQDKQLDYATAPGNTIGYFFFNAAKGPTAERDVRQALIYATNREEYIKSYFIYNEDASKEIKNEKLAYLPTVYANPLNPEVGAYIRNEENLDGMRRYDFDLSKASEILDQSGWILQNDGYRYKNGQKLTVRILIADGSRSMETLVPIIVKDWKAIGVDLKQNTVDFNTLISTVTDDGQLNNWETSILAYGYTTLSNVDMNATYKTGEINNYGRLSNPKLDSLLDQAMYTADIEESTKYYKKAMILLNEEAAYIPLYGANSFNLYNKRVKNLKTSSFYEWSDAIADAYLE